MSTVMVMFMSHKMNPRKARVITTPQAKILYVSGPSAALFAYKKNGISSERCELLTNLVYGTD